MVSSMDGCRISKHCALIPDSPPGPLSHERGGVRGARSEFYAVLKAESRKL